MKDSGPFSVLQVLACAIITWVLDRSGSMSAPLGSESNETKADGVRRGVEAGREYLRTVKSGCQPLIGYVTFNETVTTYSPVIPEDAPCPDIAPGGLTHLGTAIHAALDMTESAMQEASASGVPVKRPTIAVASDGLSAGEDPVVLTRAQERLEAAKQDWNLNAIAIVVTDEDEAMMRSLGFTEVHIARQISDWERIFRLVSIGSVRGGRDRQRPFNS